MKRLLAVVTALSAISIGLAQPGSAANNVSTPNVVISAADVNTLAVTSVNSGFSLDLAGAAGTTAMTGTNSSSTLSLSHNSTTAKSISAVLTVGSVADAGNDISMSVTVTGGSAVTLLSNGAATAGGNVLTGVARGALNAATVQYDATASTSKTPTGAYNYTVTYTST